MGAGRDLGRVVARAVAAITFAGLLLAAAGCSGDDDGGSAACVPSDVVDEVADRAGEVDVDRCAPEAQDELEAAVVRQSIDELGDGAVAYAEGGPSVGFEGVIIDVSTFQGVFVDRTNRAAFEDLDGEAQDRAVSDATDRFDDARCRAGLLAWDGLRHAERETGRSDLLTDDQRAAWREVAGDPPSADPTPYADLSPTQQDALCAANLTVMAVGDGPNWGDRAEEAFAAVPPSP